MSEHLVGSIVGALVIIALVAFGSSLFWYGFAVFSMLGPLSIVAALLVIAALVDWSDRRHRRR